MLFDVQAALAEVLGRPPAACDSRDFRDSGSQESQNCENRNMAGPESANPEAWLVRDLYEERAAIREHDGAQDRAEAEAAAIQDTARALGITGEAVRFSGRSFRL